MAEILIFFPIHTVYVNQEDSMQGNAYSSLKSLGPRPTSTPNGVKVNIYNLKIGEFSLYFAIFGQS